MPITGNYGLGISIPIEDELTGGMALPEGMREQPLSQSRLPFSFNQQSPASPLPEQPQPQQGGGLGIQDILRKTFEAMSAMGSGYHGTPDPVIERKLKEAQLQRQDQQMELEKRQQAFREVEGVLKIFNEVDIPDQYKTPMFRKWAEKNPIVQEMLGAHVGNASIKGKILARKGYEAKEGEIVFGGKSQPAGVYDFEGYPKDGKWVVTKLEANKDEATQKRFEERQDAIETRSLRSQEQSARQFQQAQSATESRFQQSLEVRDRAFDEQQRKNSMLLPSQQKVLTGNRTSIKTIDNYEKAFDDFIKDSKGGALSDMIRGGIAKNLTAQRAADLVFIEGRTPAEKKFAAEYNSMIGSVRSLTDEVGVLTNEDIPRIMGSFNPGVERGQFKANVAARRRTHQRVIDTALEDYQAMGKDISKFLEQGTRTQSREVPAETYERGPDGKLRLKKQR